VEREFSGVIIIFTVIVSHDSDMEGEARRPPTVSGERLHWLWRQTGTGNVAYRSVLVSAEVAAELGPATVTFTESLPLGRIPQLASSAVDARTAVYQVDPTRILGRAASTAFWETVGILDELESTEIDPASWPVHLLPDGLRHDLSGAQNTVETLYLGRARTTTAVGDVSMHERAEKDSRRGNDTPFTESASASRYSGPLFVYAVSTESETGQRVLEPRAPVTLAWSADSPDTPAVACGTTFH
jgi:hypothetical protein